jgi:hypothetical protein
MGWQWLEGDTDAPELIDMPIDCSGVSVIE